MPLLPDNQEMQIDSDAQTNTATLPVLIKNRRKRYLDLHPEYFSADLELAGPHAPYFHC